MDISVIMATARPDYPIIGQPEVRLLVPTIKSLSDQTFKDFEFILVDALHSRREPYDFSKLSFPVKHVPVHPNHRFWLDRGRWNVCGQLNTGILHAEGELLVRIDDCSEFGEDFLQRFWDGYQKGFFPMAMHIRYLDGKPAKVDKEYMEKGYEAQRPFLYQRLEPDRNEILRRIYGEEGLVRDTRYPIVKAKGGHMIAPPEWFYGYSSLSLEAALKVNGFNELFDGDKGQEDQEMGMRLSMAGYSDMFLLDEEHQVIEHEHEAIPADIITRNVRPIKCNYAIFLLNRSKGRWKANSELLMEEDLEFIREESLRPPCSPRPNFYQDDCQGELFDLWAQNVNIFDLREERLLV